MLTLDEITSQEAYRYIYVIEVKKTIVAFVCFIILLDEVELEAIYVDHNFRKKGYATLLLQKMIEASKSKNCHSIFLEVRESNISAQHLYLKNDFAIIHKRYNYYGKEDGLLMKKELR